MPATCPVAMVILSGWTARLGKRKIGKMHMKSVKGFTHQKERVNKDEGRAQKMKGFW